MVTTNLSKNDEWYTPFNTFYYFDKKVGGFEYDPATTIKKASEFRIKNFDTIETDGLKTDWSKYRRIWINPPFSKKKEFLSKAIELQDKNNNVNIFIVLPIESLSTKWFHEIVGSHSFDVYIFNGRIKFESETIDKKSPAFGSVVVNIREHKNNSEIVRLDLTQLKLGKN